MVLHHILKRNVELFVNHCIAISHADQRKAPVKEQKHRAMDDIRESIQELKFYKDNIFKVSKSRK